MQSARDAQNFERLQARINELSTINSKPNKKASDDSGEEDEFKGLTRLQMYNLRNLRINDTIQETQTGLMLLKRLQKNAQHS